MMKIHITGQKELQAKLERFATQFPKEAGGALLAEAEIEMTESKRRVPVDTGALRSSGFVEGPNFTPRAIECVLGFGGPAAEYAAAVHEDLDAHHPTGEAKFLERPLMEAAPYLLGRLADRLDLTRLLL